MLRSDIDFIIKISNRQQKELAELVGVKQQQLQNWITGRRPVPKKHKDALSKYLYCDITEPITEDVKVSAVEQSLTNYFGKKVSISLDEVEQNNVNCPVHGEHDNCSSTDYKMASDSCIHAEHMRCETCEEEIYYNADLHKWFFIVQTYEWDSYNDGFREIHLPINYCPECGKHLANIH